MNIDINTNPLGMTPMEMPGDIPYINQYVDSYNTYIANNVNNASKAGPNIGIFQLKDEETYSKEITEFRKKHKDADDLFNKRDEAINEFIDAVNNKISKEHIRIAKKRMDILNGYISRLIIGFFKKQELEEEMIKKHYEDWSKELQFPVPPEQLKTYAESGLNDIACEFAKIGMPFVSEEVGKHLCIPRGPTTECNAADITSFQKGCFQYTERDPQGYMPNIKPYPHDNIAGYPQHLAWGEKELSQAKCASGVVGVGRQERGVCGLGYYMGKDPNKTFNNTRCHLDGDQAAGPGGWTEIGNFNDTCAIEAGGNAIQGVDSTFNYKSANGPPDLLFGAKSIVRCATNTDVRKAKSGGKAKCELGSYYLNDKQIHKIERNVSHCVQPIDLDINTNENANMVCRTQVGFKQKMPSGPVRGIPIPYAPFFMPLALYSASKGKKSGISINQPSQYTFGMKEMYDQGKLACKGWNRRIKCEMGYSLGVELEPWSTECVKRLDNMGEVCKNTYGSEWFPWPQKQSSWNQGCAMQDTRTRATCRKDDMVPVGTEFTNVAYEAAGQQCTTTGTAGLYNRDYACNADYGPNYDFTDYTKTVDVKYGTPNELNDKDADYTDFSADRDKCTGLMERGKCKKTRDINDFKNSICLWTNRSCGGHSCKERCESAGKGWVALNENKNCNSLQGGENPGCICCTVNNYDDNGTIINKTDEYLATGNAYYSAILDTQGILGQKANTYDGGNGVLKPVGTNDLFICKHAAFMEDRPNEKNCVNNLTTDLKKALDDPGKFVYTPYNSNTFLMRRHLRAYKKLDPNQTLFKNTSNYAWPNMYNKKLCKDQDLSKVNSCLIKRSDISPGQNQPWPWSKSEDCVKGEYTWDLSANYWYACTNPTLVDITKK